MLRVVVAEPGPEGDGRGATAVARALRDAGHEVVWAGGQQTPEQIVQTAIQEDADLVVLFVGSRGALLAQVTGLLRDLDAADIVVFGAGTFSEEDLPAPAATGVARVFAPGELPSAVVEWIAGQFAEG